MRRRTTHALLSLSCMAAAAVAFAGTPDKTPAKAAPAATAMQDVAGSAVVASLRSQFDGRDVEFKLTDVDAQRVSLRDTVLSPAITLDRNSATSPQAPTAGLDEAVAAALGEEFASQHVAFQLDSAWRTGGGERFAVVDGQGVARFEGEGEAEVRLQAVYDLADERWIHVGYALGGEPAPDAPAFAVR